MKKTIIVITALTFLSGIILTSCNSPVEKVETAENNVVQAKKDLDKANKEYMADIDNYKKETWEKTKANEQSIADFKLRIQHEKKEAKAKYKKRIAELEEKNSDMKKKMDDYKADGKENWELFKSDFNKSMNELGQAFKDLTTSHKKK